MSCNTLLTEIQQITGASYLSDLHTEDFKERIKDSINLITPNHYALDEWNKAASYFLGKDIACEDIQSVRELLINRDEVKTFAGLA